jgi:hypothetical protein
VAVGHKLTMTPQSLKIPQEWERGSQAQVDDDAVTARIIDEQHDTSRQ